MTWCGASLRGATVAGLILLASAAAAGLEGQTAPPPLGLAAAAGARRGFDPASRPEDAEGPGSYRLRGAAVGFVLGAGATYLVLNHGGSTSRCDRSANQDAMGSRECYGAYVLGGLIGAGVGAGVGSLFRASRLRSLPLDRWGVIVLPTRRIGVEATLNW